MWNSQNQSRSADLKGRSFAYFRDWFHPIHQQYGGAAVFNRYFTLLSQCFPKKEINVGGRPAKQYARRATLGEVVHFWSGAAGVNLTSQFTKAFGWTAKIQSELSQAQRDMPCANTYPK